MSGIDILFDFETKYPFLYRLTVNGVPLYTCLRDSTLMTLREGDTGCGTDGLESKGRIYPKRLLDGMFRLPMLRRAKTVIFTSAVYRRDYGRNLAAEYLTERYPEAAVFEWPSRNEAFDRAYFSDPMRKRYCPLDFYLVIYKLAHRIHRKRLSKEADRVRLQLQEEFAAAPPPKNENETAAIQSLLDTLPGSYVTTKLSHRIFQRLFRRYESLKYAIDFWGSGRENVFPVLPGNPEKIELQHGLINSTHPGYIYPAFVGGLETDFFKRTLLVYGEKTKRLLCENSVFSENRVEVIGNPRLKMYRCVFGVREQERNLILFTSQPFEQDGKGTHYYDYVIPQLQALEQYLNEAFGESIRLCVKLHPREGVEIVERYKSKLVRTEIMLPDSPLYELLLRSYIHITTNSTVLYEATAFNVPTITLNYGSFNVRQIFGNDVIAAENGQDLVNKFQALTGNEARAEYLEKLRAMTRNCM